MRERIVVESTMEIKTSTTKKDSYVAIFVKLMWTKDYVYAQNMQTSIRFFSSKIKYRGTYN
jgi:hypothetical protein